MDLRSSSESQRFGRCGKGVKKSDWKQSDCNQLKSMVFFLLVSVWDSFWHVLIIPYTWKIEICSICSMTFCLNLCAVLLPECRNLGTFPGLILAWEHCLVSCQMWWRGKEVDIIKCFPLQPTHPLWSWLKNYWPGVTEVKGCTPLVRCRAKHRNPHFCSIQVRWSGHLLQQTCQSEEVKWVQKAVVDHNDSCYQVLPQVCVLSVRVPNTC